MTPDPLREMSAPEFQRLSADELAYVRATIIDDETRYVVSAADGRALGVAPDYQTAIAAALEHDFVPVSVH